MYTTGKHEAVVVVDPSDEAEDTERDAVLIDEEDLPSSSRSMSLLMVEALAAIEKYPDSGALPDED
jgi:hypothetical protein